MVLGSVFIIHNKNKSYNRMSIGIVVSLCLFAFASTISLNQNQTLNNLFTGKQQFISSQDDSSKEMKNIIKSDQFYSNIKNFYAKMKPEYSSIIRLPSRSPKDISLSASFMKKLKNILPSLGSGSAFDVGAGVGRVSKQYLVKNYQYVDLLEQDNHLLEMAIQNLKNTSARTFYFSSIQQFEIPSKYDMIWMQAVLSHLTDDDIVDFLSKAKNSLTENGVIILKAYIHEKGWIMYKDSGMIFRSATILKRLFEKANLKTVYEQIQRPHHRQQLMIALR